MKTRIPLDDCYVLKLGKAIYCFLYFEWTVVYILERLEPGFLIEFSRGGSMTSGEVYTRFKNAVDMYQGELGVSKDLLKDCCSRYGELVPKRNALVHAHPITDIGGSQILNYQGAVTRPISDLKWSAQKLAEFIEQIDKAVSEYSKILHSIKPGTE